MSSVAQFINLNTRSRKDEFPLYAALYLPEESVSETLFSLTPDVMKWSENVWLLHLEPCRSFWSMKKSRSGLSFDQIFEKVFFNSFKGPYLCVFAHHPWQALFFMSALKNKEALGCYFLNSLLSRRIYKNLTWEDWFTPMEALADHLNQLQSGFVASEFRSKQNQLKRFIVRMNLRGPFELSQADEASMTRRFSSLLGKIWKWTLCGFSDEPQKKMDLFSWSQMQSDLQGFPWQSFELTESPQVERHLEYPISQWDVVEPLLKEDLEKLCDLKSWSNKERVMALCWEITLYNLDKVPVWIVFRHPHALHEEKDSGFKTALYQAYYAYVGLMSRLTQREEYLDLPEQMPFLNWKLVVTKRMYQNPQVMSLLPKDNSSVDYEQVIDLQNKLALPLEHYEVQPDYLPEQGFQKKSLLEDSDWSFSLAPWRHSACKRPLFYYSQPKEIKSEMPLCIHFLERTAQNWWEQGSAAGFQRDYYLVELKGQFIWAYRDQEGKWFEHGIYS